MADHLTVVLTGSASAQGHQDHQDLTSTHQKVVIDPDLDAPICLPLPRHLTVCGEDSLYLDTLMEWLEGHTCQLQTIDMTGLYLGMYSIPRMVDIVESCYSLRELRLHERDRIWFVSDALARSKHGCLSVIKSKTFITKSVIHDIIWSIVIFCSILVVVLAWTHNKYLITPCCVCALTVALLPLLVDVALNYKYGNVPRFTEAVDIAWIILACALAYYSDDELFYRLLVLPVFNIYDVLQRINLFLMQFYDHMNQYGYPGDTELQQTLHLVRCELGRVSTKEELRIIDHRVFNHKCTALQALDRQSRGGRTEDNLRQLWKCMKIYSTPELYTSSSQRILWLEHIWRCYLELNEMHFAMDTSIAIRYLVSILKPKLEGSDSLLDQRKLNSYTRLDKEIEEWQDSRVQHYVRI